MSYIGSKPANKPVVASDLDPTVITGQTALATSPADTDEFLISDAGVLKRLDASLVGSPGITVADNWRLNADDATDAAETDLDTGWERVDTTGQGTLGSAMTQSSGVFTFPSTGIYLVQFQIYYIMSGGNGYGRAWIKHKNSSTYTTLVSLQNYQIQNESMALCVSTLFDCQNTTNDTVVFYGGSGTNGQVIAGSTSESRTAATFIRLGDT